MNPVITKGNIPDVIEHVMLVAILACASALFVYNNVLWRWDYLLYDAQLSFWSRAVSDDIIIIAIDDESLKELGRWPWPRSTHARLINRLEPEHPRAIGLDVIFSEPDANNTPSDVLLSRAIKASGKVVLPVFMTQQSRNSYPIEALPLPEFTNFAAALGHVHVDISEDGIVRRVFLKEGIGEPHWMHYSLAILGITDDAVELRRSVNKPETDRKYSALQWSREYPFLIPFAGPPGHFRHIGYSQVLSGKYAKDLFRDKIVLIGTTAEGLGDSLPTPMSGKSGMPGIEIIANVIDAIQHKLRIREPDKTWLTIITALLAVLPVLIYPYLNPGKTLLALFCVVTGTITAVALLLWLASVWIPASTILLFQFISYPVWSWRRLVIAMRHINAELNLLSDRQKSLSMHRDRNIADEIRFIQQFLPIRGWVLQDENGSTLLQEGAIPAYNLAQLKRRGWNTDGYRFWAQVRYHNMPCRLGLSIGSDAIITDNDMRLLNNLISTPLTVDTGHKAYAEDVLQTKINQVKSVGREYEELRRIIDDSLSGMADGVLICSSHGQVMLSNHRAGWYLYGDDDAAINGKSITSVLERIRLKDGEHWTPLLQRVLFRQERVLAEARHEEERDLMVEISPVGIIGDALDGFVVNLSDTSLLKASERKRNEVINFLSHDLRAPLSSMIAMIELAKNKSSLPEMRSMLDDMDKNVHKTLHLAEQFLQLARANTTENIHFYDIDFNSVVLNAIDQLWALSSKMDVAIEHEFDHEELWTHAEPDLLERAIINLLSNAIKHSEAGKTVRIIVKQKKHEISCCVIDHGHGISLEDMPHLFDMFRRTQGSGTERIQGIGLGLAFVDAVARRHSGHVDVESRAGEGSVFCLIIPKVDPQEPAIQ